jgi:hypothetical protein
MHTAVIIEPRLHPCLNIVLNNFNKNLNDNWKFLIFHGTYNKQYIMNIFNNMKTTKKCTYVNLNKHNLTILEYNKLLYSHSFYEHITTEHFLIFQTDTLISDTCKNFIYKFMQFDYCGAPWKWKYKQENINNGKAIGNGGLSLRKKSKMLELLNNNFSPAILNTNEDLFFSGNAHNKKNIVVHKPPLHLAKEFSVESVFSHKSFGLHKVWNYLNNIELNILKKNFSKLNYLINITGIYNKIISNQRRINKIIKMNKNKNKN